MRSVLISGTSTGIGAAAVARLAGHGWRVYAGVRRPEDGERLTSEIEGEVVPVILDVTDRAHIAAALARIDDEVGRLEGLVNNAGIAVGGPVELLSDDDWQRTFDVNLFGLVALTREAFPLVRRAGGRFVHIGSIEGRIGSGGVAPYTASKHAVEGFNWALREELSRSKMTSSVVEPGLIATSIWDKGDESIAAFEARLDADPDADARYRFLVDTNRGFAADGHNRGIDADRVAKAIEHALTSRHPRARYLVGLDAEGVGNLVTRLPDRAREALMGLNNRRMEWVGHRRR